jgi:hypothetical protein
MAFEIQEIGENLSEGVKGLTKNKGGLLLLGVGGVLLFVVFRRKPAPQQTDTGSPDLSGLEVSGYPTMNPSEVEGQFANYQSQILSEVNSNLSDFMSDIMEQTTEIGEQNREYIDDVREGLEKNLGVDPATVEKRNTPAWTVGYGTTGTGNPNEGVDFSKDRAKLKEEIERTQSVINYREGKGLDITAQNRHLTNLRKL